MTKPSSNYSQLNLQRSLPLGFYTYITGKLAAWGRGLKGVSLNKIIRFKVKIKITEKQKDSRSLKKQYLK